MNFVFNVVDTTGSNGDLVSKIAAQAAAAGSRLKAILNSSASIEVTINIAPTPSGTANGTSATSSFVTVVGGINLFQQGATAELKGAPDPNGAATDIVINIDPTYMRNEMQFDPTPSDSGFDLLKTHGDMMSVILHELVHGLSFNGWRDGTTYQLPGDYMSTFDRYVSPTTFQFNGPWTLATLGQGLQLTRGNAGHSANPGDAGSAQLDKALMNGVVWRDGYRYEIGLEEIAVMIDTGVPLKAKLGTSGNDTLSAASHPIVLGGKGNDKITGSSRSDTMLSGGVGNDTIAGGAGNDKIEGGPGNDTLKGDTGIDYIVGGFGRDVLTGGTSRDYFIFEQAPRYSAKESGLSSTTRDYISDFVHGTDKLDIGTILTDPIAFKGQGALTGAGQVHFKYSGSNTLVEVSLDADSAPELTFTLKGRIALTSSDFVL